MFFGKVLFRDVLLVCDGASLLREDASAVALCAMADKTKAKLAPWLQWRENQGYPKHVFLRNEPTDFGV